MTTDDPRPWRDVVQAFFDDVAGLMARGDPRVVRLGTVDDSHRYISERAESVHHRLWNMQFTISLPTLARLAEANDTARGRKLDDRDIFPVSGLRSNPLLPSIAVDLRIGWVPAPLLLTDDDHAFLAGPEGTEHQWTIWESTDPGIVAGARAVYLACWDHARPWQEVSPRPRLSGRLLEVAVRLAEGQSDREIAEALGVGARTASAEVRRVIDWCGARSRGHAIAVIVGADR